MTLRSLIILIAVVAVLLAIAPRLVGRRPGVPYLGRYWYFDTSWPFYHEVRGGVIYDNGRAIFVD